MADQLDQVDKEVVEEIVETIERIENPTRRLSRLISTESFPKLDLPKEDLSYYYTILAPQTFRPNTDFVVHLTLYKGKAECYDRVEVTVAVEDEQDENNFHVEQNVILELNKTKAIALPIGDVDPDQCYKFVVKGDKGLKINSEASLDVQTKKVAIFIQSDKSMYKPNDIIKFRVLVLNEHLKPATLKENNVLNIHITDSYENRIKHWQNVKTNNGVYSDEIQLSDLPNFGEWKITAEAGLEKKVNIIEVAEYVLPKFSATIEANDHWVIKQEKIKALIRAKYTYGKDMRGKATIKVTEEYPFDCYFLRDKKPEILVEKTVPIDGRGEIELDIANELKFDMNNKHDDQRKFKIQAEVVGEFTEQAISCEKCVTVYKHPYNIITDLEPCSIKQDSINTATITVLHRDGSKVPIDDTNKKIKIIQERYYTDVDGAKKIEEDLELNENAEVTIKIETTRRDASFLLKAQYMDQTVDLRMFYIDRPDVVDRVGLDVKVLSKSFAVNAPIEIDITTQHCLQHYSYLIIARGKVIEANTREFTPTEDGGSDQLVFVPTYECTPKLQVLVYILLGKSLCSKTVTVELRETLNNFIELNVVPESAKPGETVDLNISSNPKSFIGLLGVDQSVMLLRSGNDLALDAVWNEIDLFHSQVSYSRFGIFDPEKPKKKKSLPQYANYWEDFDRAKIIIFTNTDEPIRQMVLKMRCDMLDRDTCYSTVFGGPPSLNITPFNQKMSQKLRKFFPETWIWETIKDASADGKLVIHKKVPDTITSWILTGFSINPERGLALTKNPCKLQIRQPFFVSLNLPYSIKRGEVVDIPCIVFNYLEQQLDVEVTLENLHNEFEFVDMAFDSTINPESCKEPTRKKKMLVFSNDGAQASFAIRPTKIGIISLKVTATSPVAGDTIIRTIIVESEGVAEYVNKTVFVDLREKNELEPITINIDVPEKALPDSTRIELQLVGDLLGGTIKNLEKLIRLPSGCGEQNMLNFVPNIVILNYLIHTKQLTPDIEKRAKNYMEIGYQRELTYKHSDGSFSAFGASDQNGSTWLTAFVAKSFQQAAYHVDIDDKIVDATLQWLSNTQNKEGAFVEQGDICHKEMQGGASNGVALTAYVLTAFLQNEKNATKYKSQIELALKNIDNALKASPDVYSLSVASYALQLAKHDSKQNVLKNLLNSSKSAANLKWWEKTITDTEFYREPKTLNVEITSYALLALLNANEDSQCLDVLKWLLSQRNSEGGFEGTQDTVLGIEALAQFAEKCMSGERDISINVSGSAPTTGVFQQKMSVNKENSLVLQSEVLPANVETLNIAASGKGSALLQVCYRYYVKDSEPQAAFALKIDSKLESSGHINIKIDTSFNATKSNTQSNMALLEVEIPSGFVVDGESLEKLKKKNELVKKVETKKSESIAVIYFDHISKENVSVEIEAFRIHMVTEQKPVSVMIYDYYDSALSAREFYLPNPVADFDLPAN